MKIKNIVGKLTVIEGGGGDIRFKITKLTHKIQPKYLVSEFSGFPPGTTYSQDYLYCVHTCMTYVFLFSAYQRRVSG